MNICGTTTDQEIIFWSILALVAVVVCVVIFVNMVDNWAFDRGIRDWEKENPSAAPIFRAINDDSYGIVEKEDNVDK